MTTLMKRVIEGEVWSPRDTVRVIGYMRPFGGGRIDCHVPAGLSISEILGEALADDPELRNRRDFIVMIDEHYILEVNWSRIRLKPGVTLNFMPRLQGGGNVWKSVLSLVVTVAALVVAPWAVGLIGLTGIAASIGTALIAGGIMLAGTLALNALFPTRLAAAPDSVNSTSLNSIQGAQNQANPFGAVPIVLGKHRQSPYFAAKPYTEIIGVDQYLRLLFCLGYGPLQIEDMRIGETPLTSFADYWLETKQGFVTDTAATIYPGEVNEASLSVTLAPFTWNSQTTAVDTDEISVDFTATQGVIAVDKKGEPIVWDVTVQTRYRKVGTVSWTNASNVVFGRSYDPTRRGLNIPVARGQYEVQVQRASAAGDPLSVKDTIVWSALRSLKAAPPLKFSKPLALVALRIKATNQLSGVINTFNCVTTSLVNAYSGSGSVWKANTASQNPADLFRHVLQGPANARPVPDALINMSNLQAWWTYCKAQGFTFNQVINAAGSVYDKLCDIASAGRAVPTFIDGQWGVVWDRPSDSIVQHFTPRNSSGFSLQRAYAQQPHGWRVSFINEKNGYTTDERIVYDDGYDATNATLFEGIQFPGVTNPDLIWKHGRFHIAQSRLRPEKISLSVGWENLICTRGDRVAVTHDVLLVGLASGRVKSVAGQVVTFDETVTLEATKTYGMSFRLASQTSPIIRAIDVTPTGEYNSLTLVGDLTLIGTGDLFTFGETDSEYAVYRVQSITHQKDLIAQLTLVDDAPDISIADRGTIPPYNPHVTIPPDPFTLSPYDLRYLEVIEGQGTSVSALVRLYWQVPRFGKIASFQVQSRDDDIGGDWITVNSILPPHLSCDIPLPAAGVWSFRVRCIFTDGTASDWSSLIGLNLLALSAAPGDVVNLHQRYVDGQTVLDWNVISDLRVVYYEIRKGTSWDTALVVGDVLTQPPWPTTGDGIYHVRGYILTPFGARIYSGNDASIIIEASIIVRNIVLSVDEQATGWSGALDGGVISGSFIRTDVSRVITIPWAKEIVNQLSLKGLHIAVYASASLVDIGRAAECRFWTEFEASGVMQGADFLSIPDVLASGDILGTSPTRFIRAFPIWRFATSGDHDIFGPGDVYAGPDIFTADIDWGNWTAIASGTRVEQYFQPGYVLISDEESTDAIGTKFKWFVDVPDRTDSYTNLAVPNTGLAVTFYSGGFDAVPAGASVPVPFNGGPNGALVPHVQRAIINGNSGDEVKITNLTLRGCTVNVLNGGVNVARSGINLLVLGY